jgi:L-tartrate/succinate antiporter
MPSNTARSGGSIYPVAINIPHIFNSYPDNEPRKIGAYISWVAIATTCVTSSMFLTALAPNLLAVDLISKSTGHTSAWMEWAKIMIPLMLPLFILTPWLTYVLYPPTQKKSPEAPAWATEELKKLGSVTFKEYLMAGLATVALVLWIFGKEVGIDATVTAICVVSVMVLSGVISWDDLISNKAAFDVLIWFSSLVAMASGLQKVGVLTWIGTNTQTMLAGMSPTTLIVSLLILFFLLHYFFASVTAHVTALVPIFMTVAVSLLTPEQVVPFTIILAGSLGVMGIITPYGTGPSPIWYGAGYISQGKWWALGAMFGALYLAVMILGAFIFI